MKVVCSSNGGSTVSGADSVFSLFASPQYKTIGRIGTHFMTAVRRYNIRPASRTWDFVSIALSVAAADFAVHRAISPDGWTRDIELVVPVATPRFWKRHCRSLEAALGFLTGDIWTLKFTGGAASPPIPSNRARRHLNGDAVYLFSGGADSLVGAIDAVSQGMRPILVSQVASGDKAKQVEFASALGLLDNHLQLSHAIRPAGPAERSQRSRSIVFLAYGLMAAMHLSDRDGGSPKELIVPENGFISINVPLTPLRIGSLSTRTTHPFFISQIQTIFDACGFPVLIRNPYQFLTKGEMFGQCRNQDILKKLASKSTSCGKYGTHGRTHCGRCVPCLVRRSAFFSSGLQDDTDYKFENLSIQDTQHLYYDDVQAVRFAVNKVYTTGCHEWAGGTINSVQLGDTAPYFDVTERGIHELSAFLDSMGVQ